MNLFRKYIYKLKIYKKYLILFIIIYIKLNLILQFTYAKNKTKDINFFDIVEEIFLLDLQSEPIDILREKLWIFYNDPIELNINSLEQIKELAILTDEQIKSLIKHINEFGNLLEINELQVIPYFDINTIKLLRIFIKISKKNNLFKNPLKQIKNSYSLLRYKNTYQLKDNKKKILGKSDTILSKTKIKIPNKFKFGFEGKKFPGEAFVWDKKTNRYYFNSYSGSLEFENNGIFKSFVIGDYQFGCGQGLISSEGFSMNKVFDILYLVKNQKGLQSYQSSKKNSIFRGASTTIKFQDFDLNILYSYLKLDASIIEINDKYYVDSIPKAFIYKTDKDLEKKENLIEQVKGFSLIHKTNKNKIQTGFAFLYQTFDPPLAITKTRNDYDYILRGERNINFSCFGKYFFKNICFFSEAAISKSDKSSIKAKYESFGLILGSIIALNKKLDLGFSGRYYGPYFHSIRGNAFRQTSSEIRNEKGFFISAKLKPINNIHIETFIDIFSFPRAKYSISKPSNGYEVGSKLQYLINKKHLIEFKLKNKNKDRELKINNNKEKIIFKENIARSSIKYKWKITNNFNIKTEVSIVDRFFNNNNNFSFLIAQDLEYKFRILSFKGRLAIFKAGSSNQETIYSYESKPLYGPSIPKGYRNIGQKAYLLICYKPFKPFRLEFKYEVTRYNFKEEFKIFKLKHDLTLQLFYRF